jgi:hypothetical protein
MRNFCLKITTIFLITVVFACNSRQFPVEEPKMVQIFADAMRLEAGMQIKYNYAIQPDSMWNKNYTLILKKHNVDQADFDQTLKSYKRDGKLFAELMEKVIDVLQRDEVKHKMDRN